MRHEHSPDLPCLSLTHTAVAFEDVRHTMPEFQEAKKSDTGDSYPMGQLPTLSVDGKIVCQGTPMLRYAGKLTGTVLTWLP